jgi:hypothetical protein
VKTYLRNFHTGCQWDIQKNERERVIIGESCGKYEKRVGKKRSK